MMTTNQAARTRVHAIALVNWKGVFYERFALDPGVTVLEGENGAGKTTVMIAAYVVLLPDLTYLKFVNVGEATQGGSDKGIWERLGDHGSTYSALDLRLGTGERVVAGVHLVRKGQPSVELTPFIVEGPHACGAGAAPCVSSELEALGGVVAPPRDVGWDEYCDGFRSCAARALCRPGSSSRSTSPAASSRASPSSCRPRLA
jgi:hypothetical protein